MRMHSWWIVLLVGCVSCHWFQAARVMAEQPRFAPGETNSKIAAALWNRGQEAMRLGQVDQAIVLYEQSLDADPGYTHNHLSLAAARLEKGDEEGACAALARYVEAHPDHLVIRGHLGDLLLRLKRIPEARAQFERFEVDAQALGASSIGQRIQCHSRLTRIAETEEDDYREHLHRGIGLYLLAQERAELTDEECALS